MTEDTPRDWVDEFMEIIKEGHEPVVNREEVAEYRQKVESFILSKRREEREELVKGLESMKPVGEVVSHNTYNDGQRDLINQIIIHLRGTI